MRNGQRETACRGCSAIIRHKPSTHRVFCSRACRRAASQTTRQCARCGTPVSRYASFSRSRHIYCSRSCRYRPVEVTCAWPGCESTLTVQPLASGLYLQRSAYSPKGYYGKHPICSPHLDRLVSAFGSRIRLNSFWKIVRNQDRAYPLRSVSRTLRLVVFDRADGRCETCGLALDFNGPFKSWQMDHRIPVFKSGLTALSNLQALCKSCHDAKTAVEKSEAALLRHAGQRRGHSAEGWLTHADKDAIIGTLREEIALLRARVLDLERAVHGVIANA